MAIRAETRAMGIVWRMPSYDVLLLILAALALLAPNYHPFVAQAMPGGGEGGANETAEDIAERSSAVGSSPQILQPVAPMSSPQPRLKAASIPSAQKSLAPVPVHLLSDFSQLGCKKGLNNQFWYLAGAVRDGCKKEFQRPGTTGPNASSYPAVLLPKMPSDVLARNFRTESAAQTTHEAGDLFDMDIFAMTMLNDLGCYVTDASTWQRKLSTGEVLLVPGHSITVKRRTQQTIVDKGPELNLVYKAIMPSGRLIARSLQKCQEAVKSKLGSAMHLTIHMRVEDDWVEACGPKKEKKHKGPLRTCSNKNSIVGKSLFNAHMIASSVKRTQYLRSFSHVFMLYAADRLNTKRTKMRYGAQPDPMHVWPAGTVASHPQELNCFEGANATYTERSAVTFFLGALSEGPFIGTPRSTLSMGVFLSRRWRAAQSYLYNCKIKAEVVPFSETLTQKDPNWIPTTRTVPC